MRERTKTTRCLFGIRTALAALLVLSAASCRKESGVSKMVNPNDRVCSSYASQFEAVWQGMDQGYTFWADDTVDWDARYAAFRPVFESFDTMAYVSQAAYQAAYDGLFEGLLDHHLMGIFFAPGGNGKLAVVSPGSNDYAHTTNAYAERERELEVLRNRSDLVKYVGFDQSVDPKYGIEVPGTYFALIKGRHDGEMIAYFRFTNFYLSELIQNRDNLYYQISALAPIKAFYGTANGTGMTAYGYANNDSVVGIVFDLRGNGGGHTSDLAPFVGSLSQGNNVVGYTRVKDGFGRLDYSPWAAYSIGCPKDHLVSPKPVVALVDINSVSCAELATMLVKGMPNGTVIGERTYGAVGALLPNSSYSHDMFYNGCMGEYELYTDFQQYGYLGYDELTRIYQSQYKGVFPFYVYTSTFNMVDRDYRQVEGVGVQPDIEVLFDRNRLWNDKVDVQLNRAITFIKTGR